MGRFLYFQKGGTHQSAKIPLQFLGEIPLKHEGQIELIVGLVFLPIRALLLEMTNVMQTFMIPNGFDFVMNL